MTKILAIESSCDETSAAVIENGTQQLSNVVASQIKSHMRFGGVVPEIASRHHVEQITQIVDTAMEEADCTWDMIDAIAVTQGPGLVGALLIGITAAKTLAFAHHKPLIPVNHMAGHIYANQLVQPMEFPLLSLVVSGGHTELVYMPADGEFEVIGETRDDAVGEAYDKIGRVLDLPYPGGKKIDEMAQEGEDVYDYPRAMITEENYDFSFSGLKSAVINHLHNAEQRGEQLEPQHIAASFQAAAVDVLVEKTLRALKEYPVKQLLVAGGVAANSGLRHDLKQRMATEAPDVALYFPPLSLCGDNAAMIGAAAYHLYGQKVYADLDLDAKPGLLLG
ncbi:tRNA (adenosine(37)-N6)-threonylcarbamoyltransferase complex transferase subunit TsaD [Aerococcus suis]|uniref:tRNA N6-adenosine threonylcarbamoyltransferase n=1 Tax=Aerococcus suis TaxID=371602 RepID=A0A1W1Z5V4_9LACT|nr:tRNA (adenosine(37)-N6)-threonylcarbamoyltransferase complex transferase subunit TsaD [Aerococcus suis]MCI7240026.1 tRNA (adenosine(37)-N6)-threonylcarbamoyltransferase complex transferase subunit TsaD [Aerococcus suis]MDD7758615.1 tRNA (adenosine(37)-N6)-threonylcarbamoyltransferase complex transferase subunit TsaD [Aerococcus suis]MDY4646735.1 tRNA (adenosine(37)-N6)-threonylcarbamoyltransferase complex transferase subunit TsaD [Aerococcus suis]SMC43805.1 N6-L-threonylcarbamoyladenine synt